MSAPEQLDLWIDGRVYRVPTPVSSHVKFLEDLNSRFAELLGDPHQELWLKVKARGVPA